MFTYVCIKLMNLYYVFSRLLTSLSLRLFYWLSLTVASLGTCPPPPIFQAITRILAISGIMGIWDRDSILYSLSITKLSNLLACLSYLYLSKVLHYAIVSCNMFVSAMKH